MPASGNRKNNKINITSYQIRLCENPVCGLRYPLVAGHPFGEQCPACHGVTRVVMERPLIPESLSSPDHPPLISNGIEALLDNIRSAWNVGAIFRSADCLGVQKLYLCGITPTPHHETVKKTSLGAEETVSWECAPNAVLLAQQLLTQGYRLWGLEDDPRSISIDKITLTAKQSPDPIVLIVGNEVIGVDPDLLDLCEKIIYIPMYGKKRSLNVEVAFGIAAWAIKEIDKTANQANI